MVSKKKNKRHARHWKFFSILKKYFVGLERPAEPSKKKIKKAKVSGKRGVVLKRKKGFDKRKPIRKAVTGVTAKKVVKRSTKRKHVRKVEGVVKRHKERTKRMAKKKPDESAGSEVSEDVKGEILEAVADKSTEDKTPGIEQPVEEDGGDGILSVDLKEDAGENSSAEEGALRAEMESEGIFEGINPSVKNKSDKRQMPKKPKDKKRLKAWLKEKKQFGKEEKKRIIEEAKEEKEEEKQWKEEAKRREELLKKKKSEAIKEAKEEKKDGKKREFKPMEKKKQSAFMNFIRSINYMGMDKQRISFIGNLGTMMDAGLPLLDAIRALEREVKQRQMKKIMNRIVVAVETGSSLWRAMEGQYFFTTQQIAMVRVGEESGSLVENLGYLAEQEEKDKALKSKIKTAMIYPTIVMVMLVVVVLVMGMFVLPNLVEVILALGVPLPFITRMIIKFTDIFTAHGVIIAPSIIGGMILFFILVKYTFLKIPVQWALYKVPGIGRLIREATLSRFGVVMGGLLQSGVPVVEALESVTNATTLSRYKKFYGKLWEHVQLGDSFTTSFGKIRLADKCFPASMQQLIMTGEQSGSLTKIMLKIASIHEKKASEVAEKLPVIIEPMLLLIMGGLVATIALGVLAPIYSVVGNIG